MQTWKKIILGFIAFLFMLTFPIALTWFSISSSVLNADTYKPMIPLILDSMLGQNTADAQIDYNTIKPFEPVLENWLDNTFDYVNSKTDKLNLELPSDEILKPIIKQMALSAANQNGAPTDQLTQEQIDILLEQQYPALRDQLQTQLTTAIAPVEQQLIQVKDIVKIAGLVGMIALIFCIIFIIIAILLIRQLRSIMNWIGTYLLFGSIPLLLIALGLIFGINNILNSLSIPQEIIVPITTLISSVFYNLALYAGIFTAIGLILLFVKFAFKKEQIDSKK